MSKLTYFIAVTRRQYERAVKKNKRVMCSVFNHNAKPLSYSWHHYQETPGPDNGKDLRTYYYVETTADGYERFTSHRRKMRRGGQMAWSEKNFAELLNPSTYRHADFGAEFTEWIAQRFQTVN
jgi:hypothetical protein